MFTFSERSVYPSAGSPSLHDIARGLSRACRFAGQTEKWYPVLAHTFTVAALVPEEHQLHALLHDAPEAIVSDVVSSWKTSHHSLNEATLLDRIYYELDIPSIKLDFKAQAAVKRADRIALAIEAKLCGHSVPYHDDFFYPMDAREREAASQYTKLHLDAGPLAWINGEFNQGYVDQVNEMVLQHV